MRSIGKRLSFLIGLLSFFSLGGIAADSDPDLERRDLAEAVEITRLLYESVAETVGAGAAPLDGNGVSFRRRMNEFTDFTHAVEALERLPRPALGSFDAQERMSLFPDRVGFGEGKGAWETPAARDFMVGPGQSVHPYNGEVALERTDIVKPGRAGLDFRFTRYYRSLSDYDGPVGFGWDHNHNIRLLHDRDDADRLVFLNGFDRIVFHRDGDGWRPEPGRFLSLDMDGERDEAVVAAPNGSYMVFEPLVEHPQRGWRIRSRHTRHMEGSANSLRYAYSLSGDVLEEIADTWGEVFTFAHDSSGRLVSVAGSGFAAEFSYDATGSPTRSVIPGVAIGVTERIDFGEAYEYDEIFGRRWLTGVRELPEAAILTFEYGSSPGTPEAGRVIRATRVGGQLRENWSLSVEAEGIRIAPPEPLPRQLFMYGSGGHASLPERRIRPGDGAEWRYEYNRDNLPTAILHPEGHRDIFVYDSENPDPRRRGDVLREETAAKSGTALPPDSPDIVAKGIEHAYHPRLSLPTRSVYYQRRADGTVTVLDSEAWDYEGDDLLPASHTSHGVKTLYLYNRFGEAALTRIVGGGTDIGYYSDARSDGSGSPAASGRKVRLLRDAPEGEVESALDVLGSSRSADFLAGGESPVMPVGMETRYRWDARGDLVSIVTGTDTERFCRNRLGQLLAYLSSRSGLELTVYNRRGLRERVLRPFAPRDGSHTGTRHGSFSGTFFTESFGYDALGRVERWAPTDERMAGGSAYQYRRYPSGTVRELDAPSGAIRLDAYDPDTGMLREVALQSTGGETARLQSDMTFFPSGSLRRYRDNAGQIRFRTLDCLGREHTETRPDGVTTTTFHDGLDRPVYERTGQAGKILRETWTEYGRASLPTRVTALDHVTGRKTVEYEAEIGTAGLVTGERGVRNGSWSRHLHDGLGRRLATLSPGGEIVARHYLDDVVVMEGTHYPMTEDAGVPRTVHTLIRHDECGRPVFTVPVAADGNPTPERAIASGYDEAGRVVAARVGRKTLRSNAYDSLGNLVLATVTPLSAEFGEEEHRIESVYHVDGRLSARTLHNSPLVLAKSGAVSRRSVPQTLTVDYDRLGRPVREANPDGLVLEREYGADNLVSAMMWRKADSSEPARELGLEYDAMQRLAAILDRKTGERLRSLSYNAFGECVLAVEGSGDGAVRVERRFDSFGALLEERTFIGTLALPALARSEDRNAGRTSSRWDVRDMAKGWWETQAEYRDAAGRLAGLDLDGARFAEWKYAGGLVVARNMPGIDWKQRFLYNANGDLVRNTVYDKEGGIENAILDYHREKDGTMVAVGRVLRAGTRGRPKEQWRYYAHDSHRQAVAEATDGFQPDDPERRRDELLGYGEAAELNNVSRSAFDQAGNPWISYSGVRMDAEALRTLSPPVRSTFSSSAFPLDNPDALSRGEKHALSSNRLAAVAGSLPTPDGRTAIREQEDRRFHYNDLGELSRWRGEYDDGFRKIDVEWSMRFNALGMLIGMDAVEVDDDKNETHAASLSFLSDPFGCRIRKTVTPVGAEKAATRYFSYHPDGRLALVSEPGEDGIAPREKYLWGGGDRELLMSCQPQSDFKEGGASLPQRYFHLQDHGFNIMAVATVTAGELAWVNEPSYRLFGEYDAVADITDVTLSGGNADQAGALFDKRIDAGSDAIWTAHSGENWFCVALAEPRILTELTIWAGKDFPSDFSIYVVPASFEPPEGDPPDWARLAKPAWLAQEVTMQRYTTPAAARVDKTDVLSDPYQIRLSGLRGDRVLVMWKDKEGGAGVAVREVRVSAEPKRGGGIAFAGQWLDSETGLYCHGARYRHPGMNGKFVSPDPLGFLAGGNLYAYANNDPLSWHDPDGRFAHILLGAGVGAVLGGGMYALDAWWSGAEFSWMEFGSRAALGGVAGAVSAATFGAASGYLAAYGAGTVTTMAASGAASGFTGGFVYGAGGAITQGAGIGDALEAGLTSGGYGAVGGGIGSGLVGQFGSGLVGALLSGTASGAVVGGVQGAYSAYNQGGSVWRGAARGAFRGGVTGLAISAGGWGVVKASGYIGRTGSSSYSRSSTYDRPPNYRKGMKDQVWEDNINPASGRVHDPGTGQFMGKDSPWDMGHKPGYEFWKHQASAKNRGISRPQFLDEHNNAKNYRPELPSTNRSRRLDDVSNTYLGP